MATDLKKHTTIAAGEKPTRTALAAGFLSINDIIPVANPTEATQVALAAVAAGQNLATTPIAVARADARGMHRVELCYDTAGLVWLPASGVLSFATKGAADTWGSANSAYLSTSDRCRVGSVEYIWQGAWRLAQLSLTARVGLGFLTTAAMTTVATVTLPADAPAGKYLVTYSTATDAGSVNSRFHRIEWAGVELTDAANQYVSNAPSGGLVASDTLTKTGHTGGAAVVDFKIQVNAAGPIYRYASLTVTYVGP